VQIMKIAGLDVAVDQAALVGLAQGWKVRWSPSEARCRAGRLDSITDDKRAHCLRGGSIERRAALDFDRCLATESSRAERLQNPGIIAISKHGAFVAKENEHS
jgi:hypothetical protein